MDVEQRARELLVMCLSERGFHTEAQNVSSGVDLDSYEGELQAIAHLLRFGFSLPRTGFILVPAEPTADMVAAGGKAAHDGDGMSAKAFYPAVYRAMLAARPEVPDGR